MKTLTNRKALVTGGSRGIGAAIARRLAREGADVVITYGKSADKAAALVREIGEEGGRSLSLHWDLNQPQEAERVLAQAIEWLGGLDILVNNAGIGLYKDFSTFTLEDFDQIVAVNIRAVFAGSLAALPYMGAGSRIIHIGSCQAERMPGPGGALYGMSKSALIGLTKGMARDLGPRGITVNLVHPGPVDTDMNPADGPSSDYQRSLAAISRYGDPAEIAGLVAYLAGPESSFITGAGMLIDGGTNI